MTFGRGRWVGGGEETALHGALGVHVRTPKLGKRNKELKEKEKNAKFFATVAPIDTTTRVFIQVLQFFSRKFRFFARAFGTYFLHLQKVPIEL